MTGVQITPGHTSQLLARQYDEMRAAARGAMKQATAAAGEEVRHLAPGSIREHIDERVSQSSGTVRGIVFPTEAFAKYVDEGTGVYVDFHSPIRPKPPHRALKFRDGRVRRLSRGQRPQKFMERAAEAAESRVERLLDQPAVEVTRKLAG